MTTLPLTLDYSASTPPKPIPLIRVLTVRNWVRTLAWSLLAVAICSGVYFVDKWGFGGPARAVDYRMFKNPTELPMRIFGLPHFIIALMFVASSKRMRQSRNQFIFLGLLAAGTGACVVFNRLGAHLNPFLMFLFYFYFLIHGFRDDAYFYKAYGDMPQESIETHQRIMAVLQCVIIGLL
ncbi:MAG TPA: hypothetical protein VMV81_01445, partial [Phycisphaerae bacterium]|nr:hypothetical protein [Phycisphaerae bacterium]